MADRRIRIKNPLSPDQPGDVALPQQDLAKALRDARTRIEELEHRIDGAEQEANALCEKMSATIAGAIAEAVRGEEEFHARYVKDMEALREADGRMHAECPHYRYVVKEQPL